MHYGSCEQNIEIGTIDINSDRMLLLNSGSLTTYFTSHAAGNAHSLPIIQFLIF